MPRQVAFILKIMAINFDRRRLIRRAIKSIYLSAVHLINAKLGEIMSVILILQFYFKLYAYDIFIHSYSYQFCITFKGSKIFILHL